MPIDALPPDRGPDVPALYGQARWLVAVADDARGVAQWNATLVHGVVGSVAETPLCQSRGEVEALIEQVERIAHIDDCYRRIDNDPLGLQFLLHDPGGRMLLIGVVRATPLDRERAMLVVKRVGRPRVPEAPVPEPATYGA